MDFRRESIEDLAGQVAHRHLSARELTAAALERIEATNDELNAFVAIDGDAAMRDAAAIDARIARGEDVGPLSGIPIGVKDTEDARGFPTTQGSLLLADAAPAAGDSLLVERLRQAGCVVVGKTNTPELAWKADTENRLFGRTANPWSTERSAGGSSGGSAAAVAAGQVPLATGSDGGGSIRIPAALCGLTGMKPSLGRVPAGGRWPPGWADLSSKGPITRRARDLGVVLDAVIGPDPTDLRALPMPEQSWRDALDDLRPPRRVIWSPTVGYAKVDADVLAVCERAITVLEDLGTEVVRVDDVFEKDPAMPWLTLAMVANLRTIEDLVGDDKSLWDQLDDGLASMLRWISDRATATDVVRAQDVAHRLNLRLVDLFHQAPFLLTPTVAGQTPFVGEQGRIDGIEDVAWVAFTYPFNLTRSPAGTVCAGFTGDGMPVGLQVVGPQHGDAAVLRLLALLEDRLDLDPICPFP
ncbi:MAG: putative amidase [Acidimicrobiales bacterium]|nr:putative amidase [Acidimicrobiales bacterium]